MIVGQTAPRAWSARRHSGIGQRARCSYPSSTSAVFLIVWLPVTRAMPRMIKELHGQPALGLIHAETWFSRTVIMVQYWRSLEQLLNYATNKDAEHLSAWRAFNRSVGTDGSVGIWHETYVVSPGTYENIYVNMPPFGLGGAGTLQPASGGKQSASGRLRGGKDVD